MTHRKFHSDHHHRPERDVWQDLPEGFADYLELEAQLSKPVVNAAIDRGTAALDHAPSTIVDLGSGTGGATVALATRFPNARVHSLDVSPQLLDKVSTAATAAGVNDRVEKHLIDLDDDWAADVAESVDLAWAALTLHHVADPAQSLQQIFTALRPGGVLVVTELTGKAAFAPEDLGSGSARLGEHLRRALSSHEHHANIEWTTLLTEAGFTAVESYDDEFVVAADSLEGRRYLANQLQAYQQRLINDLTDDDLTELNSAIESLQTSSSTLAFRSGRAIWVAVRPHVTADPDQPSGAEQSLQDQSIEESTSPGPRAGRDHQSFDAEIAVVGGGAAGLAAATALARSRRRVVIIDAGNPRNAPADGAHNVLGQEGISPLELLARGRKEAEAYGAQILSGQATGASGTIDNFTIEIDGGKRNIQARRIILASGLVDELPAIPGVAAGWGYSVLHCPFCHGWEVRDQRIAIIANDERAVHQAMLFRQLSDQITVFLNETFEPTQDQVKQLAALNATIVKPRIKRLVVEGTQVQAVETKDGRVFDVDAVVVAPHFNARTELYEALGGTEEVVPFGKQIPTDARGMTKVPGVWAAGNANQPMAMVAAAAAAGVGAGTAVHGDLLVADLNQGLV